MSSGTKRYIIPTLIPSTVVFVVAGVTVRGVNDERVLSNRTPNFNA